MFRQLNLIDKRDWDILVVLDACRYDYFKENYEKFIDGRLVKAVSPGSNTFEWCKNSIKNKRFKDTVCLSANPHINSKMPVGDIGWSAKGRFKKIYDLWLTEWREELPTVMPEDMVKETLKVNEIRNERIISWFIQPHAPFLSAYKGGVNPFPREREDRENLEVGGKNDNKIKNGLRLLVENFLPLPLLKKFWEYQVNVRNVDVGPERVAFANLSMKEYREAYKENVKIPLREISKMLEKIEDEKVVITADHGELLGDRKFFGWKIGHPSGHREKELIEVPWCEVKK